MPKGLFLELVGGHSKVYIEWRKRYGFPWNEREDEVDAVEMLRWFRSQFASGGMKDADGTKQRSESIKLRNLELDLEERELKHAERKQEVIQVDEVHEILHDLLSGVRRVAERLPDEYKRAIDEEMQSTASGYEARFNGHSDTRISNICRPQGDSRRRDLDDAAPAEDTPPVRKRVRNHAPRRPKGGPEVS